MTMRLSELLHGIPGTRFGSTADVEVTGLQCDSRKVVAGNVFFALPGLVHDGLEFVADAVARGARAVVVDRQCPLPDGVCGLLVKNVRLAMAQAARDYFGDPTRDLAVVGVTGTNGKTTITYLLEAILSEAGRAPAVVGTINYRFGNQQVAAPHTTPESLELLAQVAAFRAAGAGALVMEVSSHALDQFRADGIHFQVGVFTNLTPEHLDYHVDMERYFASKCRLFSELLPRDGGRAVVNIDDPYGRRLVERLPQALTCGQAADADVRPLQIEVSLAGIHGRVATPVGEVAVATGLLGDYNVENLLCAIGAAVALGLPAAVITAGLAAAPPVPGRLERVENELGAVLLVDYAHTGDALERVLETLQQLKPRRLLTVFGCGGDRDRSKRPVMGEVAARCSDLAVVTSDNPRTEDPARILADVCAGVAKIHPRAWSAVEAAAGTGRGYLVIPDRREAIRFAVAQLQAGDLLLVAGKGHEDYQILGTRRIHFDDREELRAALAARSEA